MFNSKLYKLNRYFSEEEIKSILKSSKKTLHLSVTRSEIENNDFTKITKVLKVFQNYPDLSCGRLFMTFKGYSNNRLEIYEIDEIRKYVQRVYKEETNLFFFLSPIAENNFTIMRCFFNNVRMATDGVQVLHNVEIDWELATEIVVSFINYAKSNDISQEQNAEVFSQLMPFEFLKPICDAIILDQASGEKMLKRNLPFQQSIGYLRKFFKGRKILYPLD